MATIHAERRAKFMEAIGDGVAILIANSEVTRIADTSYPFRQDNNFLYLTGFVEPDAVAVFAPKHEKPFQLFVRKRDLVMEIWNGRRHGPEGAVAKFGADVAFNLEELDEKIIPMLINVENLWYGVGRNREFDDRVLGWVDKIRRRKREGIQAPSVLRDPATIVHEMRLFKDQHCKDAMWRAGQLAMKAHRHGMHVTKPGMNERQLQAEMEYYCRMRGSGFNAYNAIVASGDNANILHYNENDQDMKDGDLVLVDFGCEMDWYASDITRTWPVNGKFTPAQKEVYDMVLKAQDAAIATLRVGRNIREMHEASALSLATSLIEKGVLKGDAERHMRVCIGDDKESKFPEGEAVLKDFFMHGTGHWLGLDVHDCGEYRFGAQWRKLEPGMVTTVEPGLYFMADNPKSPEKWRGIGVRIEDDIMITDGEPKNLTAGLPRTTAEVEEACARG